MRSAEIRRVDWRFLLPRPSSERYRHLLLLGGTADLADTSAIVGVADRVTRRPSRDDPADLVAVVGGTHPRAELGWAIQCLLPDGILYVEVDRRRGSNLWLTPNRFARYLATRGVGWSATYWVKPSLEAAEMYLPSKPAESLSWYLQTLYTPITFLRRAARAVLARVPPWMFWLLTHRMHSSQVGPGRWRPRESHKQSSGTLPLACPSSC